MKTKLFQQVTCGFVFLFLLSGCNTGNIHDFQMDEENLPELNGSLSEILSNLVYEL